MALAAEAGSVASRARTPRRSSRWAFAGALALLFAASAAGTILWCASMSALDMPMPGGWSMSMAWMRMPGQSWPGAAVSFVGMWAVMMGAMMMPSLAPSAWRYRRALGSAGEARLGRLTVLFGAGYFLVWTAVGMAVFPVGVAVATLEMARPALSRAVPAAVGVVVLAAGLVQLTPWKLRHLTCCRAAPGSPSLAADAGTALRQGLRLGLHCAACCSGPTAVLLVVGVMDLRAMGAVAVAIALERLAPDGVRAARVIGIAAAAAGLVLLARAVGLG